MDVSRGIDRIVAELDDRPPLLRRIVLRLHKRWLEKFVP